MNLDYRPKKQRLIRPGLQFRLVGVFSALVVMATVFQAVVLAAVLETSLPAEVREGVSALHLYGTSLGLTLAIWIPLVAIVGVAVTHRIAGPVHRFEKHLEAVVRGENPGTCRIRPEDELQELGERINAALDQLRSAPVQSQVTGTVEGDHAGSKAA